MKLVMVALFAGILLAAAPATADWNEPNVPGTQTYRLIGLSPQARVREYEVKDYDAARMLIAYNAGSDEPAVYDDVEGKVIRYEYEHKPTTSVLQIERDYGTILQARGFEPLIAGRGIRYPGLGVNDQDMVGYWRWEDPNKGMIWVHLHAWYNGSHDLPRSTLTIVETSTMQQMLQTNAATEAGASSLADALQENGRVAVYGIAFDFDRATIRPEATPCSGTFSRCSRRIRGCS